MAVSPHTLPTAQTAVKISGPGTVTLSTTSPLPALQPTEILVRVVCVGINPVDGKGAEISPSVGATSGCDFSGVVVALGAHVNTDDFRAATKIKVPSLGDRVFGCAFGNNPLHMDNGAFAEYVAVPACLVWSMPRHMDFPTASTLATTLVTAGLALFQYLHVPMTTPLPPVAPSSFLPDQSTTPPGRYILIHGGGTATGALAIQLINLLTPLTPITTCSPGPSTTRALHLGAAATFDYHSPTCGAEIREYTSNTLTFALDCITDSASMATCYEAIGSAGGRYVGLDPLPLRRHTRRSVVADWIVTASMFGERIGWKGAFEWDERVQDRVFAEGWFAVVQGLLDEGGGAIEPHPVEVRKGGLAKVAEGMEEARVGGIRGKKVAYTVVE